MTLCICSFGGYGASISYSQSDSIDSSLSSSVNVDFSLSLARNDNLQVLIIQTGPVLKSSMSAGGGFSKSTGQQNDKSVSRTRGFSLSDGDEYDVFDVQVRTHLEVESVTPLDPNCFRINHTDFLGSTLQYLRVPYYERPQQVRPTCFGFFFALPYCDNHAGAQQK